jgi:choline dehydrogenase-like flavoprotein
MGRDEMSVVDGRLKVYGVDNLRIADGSIMPRITTANTMAPCVIIGERVAEILREAHKIEHTDVPHRNARSSSRADRDKSRLRARYGASQLTNSFPM